ncbi:MAG: response regulator [Candidatus Aureabacteria bacterium]|nr:response regulator [Candidatus Auribacterota bacterium]
MSVVLSQAEKELNIKNGFALYRKERALIFSRVACFLISALVPLFALLDYFVNPAYLKELLIIRAACTSVVVALFIFSFTHKAEKYGISIEAVAFLCVGFSISLMIRFVGGYKSTYYAGLNLVFLAMAVLVPWGIKYTLIICLAIYASYIIPIFLYDEVKNIGMLINNNMFLLSAMVIAVVGTYFTSRLHFKEFMARFKLKQARDDLKELDRLKNQLFSRVSHELRTPLTNIILPIQNVLAERGETLVPENRNEKKAILNNAYKLMKRINEILDISKVEAGKMEIKVDSSNLNSILEDIIAAALAGAKGMGINLVFEPASRLSEIYVDTEKVEKVFSNLISNALKFTDRGGTVNVKTQESENYIEVSVSDTGIGISREDIPYIFDRFHQVDGSSSRKYEGTGLGLCLVKEFVNLHHGSVGVTSELSKGSIFTVKLLKGKDHFTTEQIDKRPEFEMSDGSVERRRGNRREEERREDDRRKTEREDGETIGLLQVQLSDLEQGAGYSAEEGKGEVSDNKERKSILVVEDNKDLSGNIARSLNKFYNVSVAYNGRQGLDKVRHKIPDLVISDVMMPEMDGNELCEKIKSNEQTQHVPVILLTARATVEDKIIGLKHGADQYVAKPFNSNELRAVTDSLLTKRELQARLNKSNLELKKTLHRLEEAQVQLVHTARLESASQLAAGVAHEIKNNIYCLRAGLDGIGKRLFMLSEGKLDIKDAYKSLVKALDTNDNAIEHSLFIINSLLDFSSKNKEGMAFCDLNKGIDNTVNIVLPTIKDKITVCKEYGKLTKIECKIEEINQVIMNMLINGCQAMKHKGTIWIKTSQKEDKVLITVADDGPGIPMEHLDKIFTPFFSTKKEGHNTGLGLSICYNIIRSHYGTIDVKSIPDKGTEFSMILPVKQPK